MRLKEAVDALAALAHEHRLSVYRLLVETGPEGLSAGAIAQRLGLPPSSLTFHLQHLHRAGLITQQRNSRQLIYAADFSVMNDLVGYLTENCCRGSECVATVDSSKRAPRKATRRAAKAA
jgi:predicted transcriptional regulator